MKYFVRHTVSLKKGDNFHSKTGGISMLRHGIVCVLLLAIAAGCSSMGALSANNLYGSWKGYDGNAAITLTFNDDNSLAIKIDGSQQFEITARYVVDYTKKPATIDITGIKLPDGNVAVRAGIIKLQDGKLFIAANMGSSIDTIDRPVDFDDNCLVLTRVK